MLKLITDLGVCTVNPGTLRALKNRKSFGLYECPVCLKHFAAASGNVNAGKVNQCKSCATTHKNYKHGSTKRGQVTPLYRRWLGMRNRCNNPNDTHYHRYGGRGITVCKEWDDFSVFEAWALNAGYCQELSLDRIDVDGNYCPDNCRYVSANIQAANVNKRPNNTSGYKGVSLQNGKWQASIAYENARQYLGIFTTPQEAAKAYNRYVLDNNLPHPINKGLTNE